MQGFDLNDVLQAEENLNVLHNSSTNRHSYIGGGAGNGTDRPNQQQFMGMEQMQEDMAMKTNGADMAQGHMIVGHSQAINSVGQAGHGHGHGHSNMKYVRYSSEQVEALERLYRQCPKPSLQQRLLLVRDCAPLCNIDPQQIKVWFQNRR